MKQIISAPLAIIHSTGKTTAISDNSNNPGCIPPHRLRSTYRYVPLQIHLAAHVTYASYPYPEKS